MLNEKVKMLLSLAETVEEGDSVITEYTGFKSTAEKMAYLRGLFPIELIGKQDTADTSPEESLLMDYHSALNAVIKDQWGA